MEAMIASGNALYKGELQQLQVAKQFSRYYLPNADTDVDADACAAGGAARHVDLRILL